VPDVVISGVAQLTNRLTSLARSVSPMDLMTQVGAEALEDTGAPDAESLVDAIVVVPVPMWTPADPAAHIAAALHISPAEHWVTATGGEAAVSALNWAAHRIGAGELGGVLLIGANTMRTVELAGRQGSVPPWVVEGPPGIPVLGLERAGHSTLEAAAGLDRPARMYPLIENALRGAHHLSIPEHRRVLGALFSPFTEVAHRNPHAWFPTVFSARELAEPTPENRMIAFPYTKRLNAVLATDQAAAVLVTDRAAAVRRGADPDRLVSWWGGAHDHEQAWYVSSRPDLAASPSMASAHHRTLGMAGVSVDDLAYLDLYSCFPVAVEVACDVLGLDLHDARGLTVTGGLPYAGGPGSAYTLHSLARMVDILRSEPEQLGLVTGNGWYLSKHSSVVLGGRPRPRHLPGAPGPSTVVRELRSVEDRSGPARILSYTVVHDRSGQPKVCIAVLELGDGVRTVARLEATPAVLSELETTELVGCAADVVATGVAPARFELR